MTDLGNNQDIQSYEFPTNGEYNRRQTRSLVFHLLYAMEEHDYTSSLNAIIDEYNRGFDLHISFDGEIAHIVQGVIEEREKLDKALKPLLENWRIDRLGACTRIVLRMSTWEMLYTDTPSSVIINEAIELSKAFSEKDAYRFVNGVLDKAAADIDAIRTRYSEE
jgi:N utilization substance protein B